VKHLTHWKFTQFWALRDQGPSPLCCWANISVPHILNFVLLYGSNIFPHSFLALLAMCDFHLWTPFIYLSTGVLDRFLCGFPSFFFHRLCFLLVWIKFYLYFHESCFYFIISRVCILYLNRSLSWHLLKPVFINTVSLKSSDNVLLNVTLRLKSPTAGSLESLPVWIFSMPRW
jgi:hypothetical protein